MPSVAAAAHALLALAPLANAISAAKDRSSAVAHGQLRATAKSQTVAELFPFYHESDAISAELHRLADSCEGLTLQTVGGPDASIDVVTMRAPGTNPVNKNFFLFGEHARELISPESGLHFVKSLCGETELADRAKAILQESEFQIVVNANAASRRKVEHGDFCLRVNPNGVDLNRNWDEHWSPGSMEDMADVNPGPKPFSEPETQAFKQLVTSYRPTTFLTVHSGTRGMYMPWAYDMDHLAQRNQPEMMQILRSIDKDHCQCPFGAAGREVGYSCPGTCLDWVYDELETPYAFAFEIFVDHAQDDELKERWEEKMSSAPSFLQDSHQLAHEHFREVFQDHPSCFVQLQQQQHSHRHHLEGKSDVDCFGIFNPQEKDDYNKVVDNWSRAYFDMAEMIAHNVKSGAGSLSSGNATVQVIVDTTV